jgi:hypothetical protein
MSSARVLALVGGNGSPRSPAIRFSIETSAMRDNRNKLPEPFAATLI